MLLGHFIRDNRGKMSPLVLRVTYSPVIGTRPFTSELSGWVKLTEVPATESDVVLRNRSGYLDDCCICWRNSKDLPPKSLTTTLLSEHTVSAPQSCLVINDSCSVLPNGTHWFDLRKSKREILLFPLSRLVRLFSLSKETVQWSERTVPWRLYGERPE